MNMEEMLKWLIVMIVLLLFHVQTVGNIEPQGWNSYQRKAVKGTVGKSKGNEQNAQRQPDDTAEFPKHDSFYFREHRPQSQDLNIAGDYKYKVRNKKHLSRQELDRRREILMRERVFGTSSPQVAEGTTVSELSGSTVSRTKQVDKYEKTLEEISEDLVGNPCVTAPCANGGTCQWKQNQSPSFTCDCKLGYTGRTCEQEVRECDHVPCNDRGECVATPSGFLCLCRDGYGGKFCEKEGKHTSHGVNIGDGVVISRDTVDRVYSTVIFFGCFLGVTVIILSIHCWRVHNKSSTCRRPEELKPRRIAPLPERAVFQREFENLLKNGEEIKSLPPGIIDVSNELCREFWCCGCCDVSDSIKVYKEIDMKQAVDDLKSKSVKRTRSRKSESRLLVKKSSHRRSSSSHASIPLDNRLSASERVMPTLERSFVQSFASLPSTIHEPKRKLSWLPEDVSSSSSDDSFQKSRTGSKRGSSRVLPHVRSRSSSYYKNQNTNYHNYRQRPSCEEYSETSFDSHRISTETALNRMKNERYYNNDAQQSMTYQTNNCYLPQQSGHGMTDLQSQQYLQYPTVPAPQYPYR